MNMEDTNQEFYFQWHITDRCNLRCNHCYQTNYSSRDEISLNQLQTVASGLFRTLSKWNKKGDISITGGEPLLRSDIWDFVNFLNNAPEIISIDFLTNGTLIDLNKVDKIKSIAKIRYIQISIDGANSQTHDKIRGTDSFSKTIKGIRLLIKNDIEVRVMFTIQKSNLPDIPAMIDLANNEGISGMTFERAVPLGHGSTSEVNDLSISDVQTAFNLIADRSEDLKKRGTLPNILMYRPIWVLCDPNILNTSSDLNGCYGAICSIGLDGICILPNADVLPCRRLPISIGNLLSSSLEEIWIDNPLLDEIANKENLKGKCHDCMFISRCSGCRAMAFAHNSDYMAEDPHCWLGNNKI